MENPRTKTGVLLMTYGSATTADGVPAYLAHIYGKEAPKDRIEEFKRRYDLIGRSPLIDVTAAQAKALEAVLGESFVVASGMRHSGPFIADAVASLRQEGATRVVGIILAPQFSSFIMEGYRTDFLKATRAQGYADEDVILVEQWPTEQNFTELLAARTSEASRALRTRGIEAPVIFTTHSLPQSVVEKDPSYLEQLRATERAILAVLPRNLEWHSAYQSAGHSPEAWLTPDLHDVLRDLKAAGKTDALIVPIQFLSDHLEVLYDLDIAAREQCEELGIGYRRIELPNADPRFIQGLAALVQTAPLRGSRISKSLRS